MGGFLFSLVIVPGYCIDASLMAELPGNILPCFLEEEGALSTASRSTSACAAAKSACRDRNVNLEPVERSRVPADRPMDSLELED